MAFLRSDQRLPHIAVIDAIEAEILLADGRAGIPFTLITAALAEAAPGNRRDAAFKLRTKT